MERTTGGSGLLKGPIVHRLLAGVALMALGMLVLALLPTGPDASWGPYLAEVLSFLLLGFAVGLVVDHWVALPLTALAYDLYAIWDVWRRGGEWRGVLPWNLLDGEPAGAAVALVMILAAVASAFGLKLRRAWAP